MNIQDRITVIKGVGEKAEKKFNKLEIFTVGDLLEHYPRGYEVYGDIIPIEMVKNMEGETVVIEASLTRLPQMKKVRKLQIVSVQVKDNTDYIVLTWFNMPFLRNSLKMGNKYLFRGKVTRKNGILVIEQPKILTKEEYYNKKKVLQPIYGLTAGLTNNAVTKAVTQVFKDSELEGEYLPLEIRKKYQLKEIKSALRGIHFPKEKQEMIESRRRIVFDEFFLFAIAIARLQKQKKNKKNSAPMKIAEECKQLMETLPYQLTEAQLKVWREIESDLSGNDMMNRLIQGDVGSGKTIIAILALLMAVKNGYQGALMVPTEVLAKQHFESMEETVSGFGVKSVLLVGSMTAKEKRITYEKIKNHEADVIIGTHALIQEKVEYSNLGLVITDEQHRFGVKQREMLSKKGKEPHILVMSATPIPRTLAIILYGDLDLSVIDTLPANRLPIKNCVVNTGYRQTAYRFMEKEIQAGRQAYVICPMVEESETIEAENVLDYTEQLQAAIASDIHVSYLHGKMKAKEKNEIMQQFINHEIDILVSTTVVEVGVNVPNATVMMIENAERFGLAQLHQLRGRVGRGQYQSYCILVYGREGKETKKRLEILNQSNDGFYIAKEDMKLRGPGDLFGIRQSGILEFKMADVFQDAGLLQDAYEAAKNITEKDIDLMCKKHERLKEKINLYAEDVPL